MKQNMKISNLTLNTFIFVIYCTFTSTCDLNYYNIYRFAFLRQLVRPPKKEDSINKMSIVPNPEEGNYFNIILQKYVT